MAHNWGDGIQQWYLWWLKMWLVRVLKEGDFFPFGEQGRDKAESCDWKKELSVWFNGHPRSWMCTPIAPNRFLKELRAFSVWLFCVWGHGLNTLWLAYITFKEIRKSLEEVLFLEYLICSPAWGCDSELRLQPGSGGFSNCIFYQREVRAASALLNEGKSPSWNMVSGNKGWAGRSVWAGFWRDKWKQGEKCVDGVMAEALIEEREWPRIKTHNFNLLTWLDTGKNYHKINFQHID